MIREDYVLQARSKAAKFCAFRERAVFEVRQKLESWELSELESDVVITYLVKENFLDESRFAKAFCHDKFEFNHWGRIKIRMMISKYQVPKAIVETALEYIDQERYFDLILKLCQAKWLTLSRDKDIFKKKVKTINYLLQKGFESSHCWAAVNNMS